jgi:hypothetical protein
VTARSLDEETRAIGCCQIAGASNSSQRRCSAGGHST